jgi:hypothetical protein
MRMNLFGIEPGKPGHELRHAEVNSPIEMRKFRSGLI